MTGRRANDEHGVTLILLALLLVAALIVVAIVIDWGRIRTDRAINKSVADAASIAGAQGLRSGPWQAVCDAYHYVLSNAPDFTSFDSEEWSDADSPPNVIVSTGCPTSVSYDAPCTNDHTTWAHFRGEARGGVTVEISSGYSMPDSAFPEDALVGGDAGDPCAQVAVVVRQQREAAFGRAAGADTESSRIRSVARLTRGIFDVAALNILEPTECEALVNKSNVDGRIEILSNGNRPGLIQVDSDATDSTSCNPVGNRFAVHASKLSSNQGANTIADATAGPPVIPGRISVFAIRSNRAQAYTEACALPGSSPATCTIAPVPLPAVFKVGRVPLDERYLDGVGDAVANATPLLNGAKPAGYTALSDLLAASGETCSNVKSSHTFDDTQVTALYIDCDLSLTVNGVILRFSAPDLSVVTQGSVSINSGAQLVFDDPRTVYLYGSTNHPAVNVGGTLSINAGPSIDCQARHTAEPTKTTKLVIANGPFDNGAASIVRMCSTSVVMADGTLPPHGTSPADNTFDGSVDFAAAGTIDWTAPNKVAAGAKQADWDDLEDLALWTETSAGNAIGGQGTVHLGGVFALPNANPFTIAGQSSGSFTTLNADAQFWTRKLELTGKAVLQMLPNPNDSIPIFGVSLVR